MNVLVYAAYAINTPHFETELEIMQRHIDANDKVYVIGCNADLLCCDVNLMHKPWKCFKCIGRRKSGLKLLSGMVELLPHYRLTKKDQALLHSLDINFKDVSDLKKAKVGNFDFGYGVLSSFISSTRNPEIDVQKYHQLIKRLCYASMSVYLTIQNYLTMLGIERVYVYNGRYAPMRAVLRASQNKSIDCFTHERGSSLNRFDIIQNTTEHDLANITRLIREAWETAVDKTEREEIASQFYLDQMKGVSGIWISFTKDQQKDLLPDNWDERKNNIALFLSSEDEFAAIGDEWEMSLYPKQYDGIVDIIESTKQNENIHYYLRVHPNLKGIANSQTNSLLSLNATNLTIIPADSPVSTYALLQNASKTITFGSTVGIEAVFWGVPSILLGPSLYKLLGATYNPESREEAISMVLSDLPPKEKLPALMYGYYVNSYGQEFNYYKSKGIYEGFFKGVRVRPNTLFSLLSLMLRGAIVTGLPHLVRWLSLKRNYKQIGILFE